MHKLIGGMIVLFIFLTGCYTVIQHPTVADEENPQYHRQIDFAQDCASCHSGEGMALRDSQQPYLPRLNYIYGNDRWSTFYESPWWYRGMFYSSSTQGVSTGEENGPLPTTSARRRFPGINAGAAAGSTTANGGVVTGSSGSSVSAGARIVGGQGSSTDSSNNSGVRQTTNNGSNNSARSATRSSNGSQSKSGDARKVTRTKKK